MEGFAAKFYFAIEYDFFSFLSLHFLLLEGFFIDLHVKQKRKSQF